MTKRITLATTALVAALAAGGAFAAYNDSVAYPHDRTHATPAMQAANPDLF